jgi:hypothetical protein
MPVRTLEGRAVGAKLLGLVQQEQQEVIPQQECEHAAGVVNRGMATVYVPSEECDTVEVSDVKLDGKAVGSTGQLDSEPVVVVVAQSNGVMTEAMVNEEMATVSLPSGECYAVGVRDTKLDSAVGEVIGRHVDEPVCLVVAQTTEVVAELAVIVVDGNGRSEELSESVSPTGVAISVATEDVVESVLSPGCTPSASSSERNEPANVDVSEVSLMTSGECTEIVQYDNSDISAEVTNVAVAFDESFNKVMSVEPLDVA